MKPHRQSVVLSLALLATMFGASSQAAHGASAAKKWNVLFLMSDDMRPELNCYGVSQIQSPNIDALALKGVRFERAYCQFPLCNPSRTSLLNGRYPTITGVLDNRTWVGALHPEFVSLPKHFKANGYVTLRTGKIFHGGIDDTDAWTEGGEPRRFEGGTNTQPANPNQGRNSDRIVVLQGDGQTHADYRTGDRAIEYLRKYGKGDKPFFLACGFTKPHSPSTAPQSFFDKYDPAQVPLPPDFAPRPTVPEGFPALCVPKRNSDLFINRDASPEAAREMKRAYWASLSWTDWNIGRVMGELDRLGLRDSTIILFWGDHGYHLGEKGKWSKHGSLFEVGTRVPLIAIVPGSQGNGKFCSRPVEALDLYPTLVELCGLPRPEGLQGDSLTALLENPSADWDRPAFSVFGNNSRLVGVAVRTARYRYVEYDGPQGGAMLFDEETDPHEMKNLAEIPDYARVRAEHHEHILKFRQATWPVPTR